MAVIGIDVGATGAIGVVNLMGYCSVTTAPHYINAKKTKRKNKETGLMGSATINEKKLDEVGFIELMGSLLATYGVNTPVFMEKVGVMPSQGLVSMASFIGTYQFQRGVVKALGFTVHDVTPMKWKRHFKIQDSALTTSKKKALAMDLARKYFPDAPLPLAKDHDKAEALLIAQYGFEVL